MSSADFRCPKCGIVEEHFKPVGVPDAPKCKLCADEGEDVTMERHHTSAVPVHFDGDFH